MLQQRVPIAGSRRLPLPGATRVAPVDPHERIEASIVVKRRTPIDERLGTRMSRADFALTHGAHPTDIAAVERFAHDAGLTVVETHPGRRVVRVAGPADAIRV